jgi:hypothetical protein
MTVDADFGGGSDSVQTYLGFDFDLGCVFASCGKSSGTEKGQ